jgi:hypothetical protein
MLCIFTNSKFLQKKQAKNKILGFVGQIKSLCRCMLRYLWMPAMDPKFMVIKQRFCNINSKWNSNLLSLLASDLWLKLYFPKNALVFG